MMSHVKAVIPMVIAVLIGLMVYNMFISGSSWFGHFESSNYDVDDEGNIYKAA